jgi:hypothetical protein
VKAFFLALAVAITALPAAAATMSVLQDPGATGRVSGPLMQLLDPGTSVLDAACCMMCSKGQACGDACISRYKTCRVGPGCACQKPGT